MTKRILLRFITYFTISSFVYYLFLVVEAISLYFNEFGYDFTYSFIISFSSIESVINFGLFISFILITSQLLKENFPLAKIFKIGIISSIIFGGITFFLSNDIVPELRITSYLNRYENARKEIFSTTEKDERINDLRRRKVSMMSIGLINGYSDSIQKLNLSQERIISDLARKIPDSIIENKLSKKELLNYNFSKNKNISNFNFRDISKLSLEIRKNENLEKQLRTSKWEINKRYLNIFLTIFLICFGVIIGQYFEKQRTFSLVCIGIVIYSQTLALLIVMTDYFIDQKNLISFIFRLTIILIVFLYLIYRILVNRSTSANNHARHSSVRH